MLPIVGVISLVFLPISLIIFIIQIIRKKPSKKIWGVVTLVTVAVFGISMTVSIAVDGVRPPKEKESTHSPTVTENQPIEETSTPSSTEKVETETEIERFARENNLSVELATDIEYALSRSAHSYKLHNIYQWTQIEDYANGQRYTGWLDMEYVWVFYINGDKVESIRQKKDLSFIYQAE